MFGHLAGNPGKGLEFSGGMSVNVTAMDEQKGIAAKYGGFLARLTKARWTDGEIAAALGVTRESAWLARERLGLPAAVRGRDVARFRRTCQRHFEASFEPLNGHEPADRRTPFQTLVAREELSRLLARLSRMTPRAWEVVSLRMEGRPLSEIARRLGISRERVRQLWMRAKDRLSVRVWPGLAEGSGKG